MEDYGDQMDVDMSETFKPLLRDWKSIQELAGIEAEEQQQEMFNKLEREHGHQVVEISSDGEIEELDEIPAFPVKLSLIRKRGKSFESSNSIGEQMSPTNRERDRVSSFDYSTDTLWSSSSTFSINLDPREDEQGSSEILDESTGKINSAMFANGNGLDVPFPRDREGTLVQQEGESIVTSSRNSSTEINYSQDRHSSESVDTVTDEIQKQVKTPEELSAQLESIKDRITYSFQQLSYFCYAPDDMEQDVEQKSLECKVDNLYVQFFFFLILLP